MKTLILILGLSLSLTVAGMAQNLVPNPSFEEYYSCPTGTSQIDSAVGWTTYRSSADYFHECSKDSVPSSSGWYIMAGVPDNVFGHQIPKEGKAYAGVFTFHPNNSDGTPYREIIGCQLSSPLTVGTEYFISFWVSPGHGSYEGIKWFSGEMGLRFSMQPYDGHTPQGMGSPNGINPAPVDNFAHIYTDSIYTDTTDWHLISGSFLADKPYLYLMLGNFFDNLHTDTLNNGILNSASYYYIDNVCVSSNREYCGITSGTGAEEYAEEVKLFPNPADHFTKIHLPSEPVSITVFDARGNLIFRDKNIDHQKEVFNLTTSNYPEGTYLVHIKTTSHRYVKKLIIIH